MTELPDPLTPPDCDLRSYDWFPFFHKRLRQSSFWKRASDLACRISVDLWSEAYEQVPAASVPDDDHLLAEWAGFGRRDMSGWLAVKDEVMSAWVRCSDGRWYHPTLSEVACAGFVKHRLHAWQKECDRLRKENARRAKAGDTPLEMPPKPSDDPFSKTISSGSAPLSDGRPQETGGLSVGIPSEDLDFPDENALRERRRERKRIIDSFSLRSKETHASASQSQEGQPKATKAKPPRKHPFAPDAFDRWYAEYPHKVGRAAAEKAFAKVEASDTVGFDQLVSGVVNYRKLKPPDHAWCNPSTWLHQARWADQPATTTRNDAAAANGDEPRVDFGNGLRAPYSTIRGAWDRGRWPSDWGPRPGEPGCLIPVETMADIMDRSHAA